MARLTDDDIDLELQLMRGWVLDNKQIKRTIHFDGFVEAVEFVNKIAKEAEKANHHPDITIKYDQVSFVLTTHDENGLTEKDFALAKRIDEVLGR